MKKKPFIFSMIIAALFLTLAFATTASASPATPALTAGPCYREGTITMPSCDGTWSFLTTNRGTELLDEIQSLVVSVGPDTGLNVGSVRMYHDLGSEAMHGAVHLNSAGLAENLTLPISITQVDTGTGADGDYQASTYSPTAPCGPPTSGTNFCDTRQIGQDGALADCFTVTLTSWTEDASVQPGVTLAPYCVTG